VRSCSSSAGLPATKSHVLVAGRSGGLGVRRSSILAFLPLRANSDRQTAGGTTSVLLRLNREEFSCWVSSLRYVRVDLFPHCSETKNQLAGCNALLRLRELVVMASHSEQETMLSLLAGLDVAVIVVG
jgi:hypothetical protein